MKRIELSNGNIINANIEEIRYVETVSIEKEYFEDGELSKIVMLSIRDDIKFEGYTRENTGTLEFEFNNDDPLYYPLNRLINNSEFIIDDDNTKENLSKYIIFRKDENTIKMIFINNNAGDMYYDRFSVFVKNIFPDARSKIRDYKEKARIVNFLRDCERVLFEDYHQVTFDEYEENLRINKNKTLELVKQNDIVK